MARFLLLLFCHFILATPPTSFPTYDSSIIDRMHPLELDNFQLFYNALGGANWVSCKNTFDNPCSFLESGCSSPLRIVCDQDAHIIEIVLPGNNLVGPLPVNSLQVLGPYLQVLDLSNNSRLTSSSLPSCIKLDFCNLPGKECVLNSGWSVCESAGVITNPPVYPAMNAGDSYLYRLLSNALRLPTVDATNYCVSSPYITCVQADNNELFVNSIDFSNLGLTRDLPNGEESFSFFSKLRMLNLTGNRLSSNWNSGDCVRLDLCWRNGRVCDFTNSGLTLCPRPTLPFPKLNQLRLSDELLAYWQWFYKELNLQTLGASSDCLDATKFFTNPCEACPFRIICGPGLAPGYLAFQQLYLKSAGISGVLSARPVIKFFSEGMTNFDLSNWDVTPAATLNNVTSITGACLNIPPCQPSTSPTSCSFINTDVQICGEETHSPTLTKTKRPSISSSSQCSITTGGLVPEGTPCATDFNYASKSYSRCMSLTKEPPIYQDNYQLPTIPTDLWCPIVKEYNLANATKWGFCNCFVGLDATNAPNTRAPSSIFTLMPSTFATISPTGTPVVTSRPTLFPSRSPTFPTSKTPTSPVTTQGTSSPTSLSPSKAPVTSKPTFFPTKLPTGFPTRVVTSTPTVPTVATSTPTTSPLTQSSSLPTNENLAWGRIFDSLSGPSWKTCSTTRNNPCGCSGVVCSNIAASSSGRRLSTTVTITSITLPNNNAVGVLAPSDVALLTNLNLISLEGNTVTLPPGTTCDALVVCSKVCKIGTVCDSTVPPPPDMLPAIIGGVIGGLVGLCLLIVFCRWWCGRKKPSKPKSTALNTSLAPLGSGDPESSEFAAMVTKASGAIVPDRNGLRPNGSSHFSMIRGTLLEENHVAEVNESLSLAKESALKLDETARRDVAGASEFLANLGLSHYVAALQTRAFGKLDMVFLMKMPESTMREVGMNLGERARLRRALEVKKGLPTDPIFGA